jgi:predicted metalloprotease with PDZ domain
MKKLLFITLFIPMFSFGMNVSYELRMPKPQNHYFEVQMNISENSDKQVEVKLPVWAPGSYLVREFSKNINLVKAFTKDGKALKVSKKSKNAWVIDAGSEKNIQVKYEVYSFEVSVRTPFLDLSHGFVSGSGIFMYVDKAKNQAGTLTVFPHESFKRISTSLPFAETDKSNGQRFLFENYDQLIDCPLEIGNQEIFEFTSAGVTHTVAMYGEANYDVNDLKRDMAKIVEAETAVFGINPNKNYTFIVHNVVDGQGGLEHMNSCVLSVNRWTYAGQQYVDFLNLVAHEYFHLWNVKRIRPIELGPFNYDEENYTSLLWVMEGFTSYYDELILRRTGFYSEETFLAKLQSSINYVEGTPGSRVQPVAHASFDAWVKAYRPNENSSNTSMTYYSRGSVLASVIDAMIVAESDGKKCLDHFMQQLYKTYYEGLKRGFSEAEFKQELAKFMGKNMDEFFLKYVDGTEIIPYKEFYAPVGLSVQDVSTNNPSFGASFREEGGKVMVKSVRFGSSAEEAGISVGDEIIGCNAYRVDQSMLEGMLNGLSNLEACDLLIARDELLFSVHVTIRNFKKPQFLLTKSSSNEKRLHYWLR